MKCNLFPFFCYSLWGGGDFGSGSGSKFNCAVRVGSDDLGYGPGSGFSFEPVQTSRKEGHAVREPSLLRGIAVLRRSGSRKKRRPPVAARSGGAGAKEEQVGRKTRCRAPGSRRGGCRPRGTGGNGPVRLKAETCCHPPCLRRSRERGTRCRLPSTGGAIAVRQEAEEHRAVHQRGPVPSHGTASEPLSWLRTKRQCVREPDRTGPDPLSSLSLLILPSPFLSPRLSLPPGTPRPP